MAETRIVRVRESLLEQNQTSANSVTAQLSQAGVTMINLMSSPGSGKTSLILRTIELLADSCRMAVIEADLDSTVDADKVVKAGVPAVQLETGGFCHVEAAMTASAIEQLDLQGLDLIILENVGNLVCTAQHATGAHYNVAILSVPEGDDKPLKYPPMFVFADLIIVNKIDYLEMSDFDTDLFRQRVRSLNERAAVIEVSCRTGSGVEEWAAWLRDRLSPV